MEQEFIIGRNPSSPIKIPVDRNGVSGQHAKIRISDRDGWIIEDLKSANGTYVRDGNGDFHRVYTKRIKESDVIRLGNGGANSFTFYAHRVIAPQESYIYEFRQLRDELKIQLEREHKQEKKVEFNGWISKLSGLAVIGLCAIAGSINGISIDPNTRYLLIACAPVVVGIIFNGDMKRLKSVKRQRDKLLLCPHCGKPISEFDIKQGQCSRCKAK